VVTRCATEPGSRPHACLRRFDGTLPLTAAFVPSNAMNPSPEQIRQYIELGLPCEHLVVDGDGQHFQALIVSPAFEGLRMLARHQLVYKALGDRMREEIHALSMKTLTPEEWRARG